MITLGSLSKTTNQEVFNQIAAHLLTQLVHSIDASRCRYRSDLGFKCAAGCLVGNNEYFIGMEGSDWRGLVQRGYVSGKHCHLISELQFLHDMKCVSEWAEGLENIADRFNLEFKLWA